MSMAFLPMRQFVFTPILLAPWPLLVLAEEPTVKAGLSTAPHVPLGNYFCWVVLPAKGSSSQNIPIHKRHESHGREDVSSRTSFELN